MSDLREMKARMGAEVDWLGTGEPHGHTPARMMARRLAARVVMGAPILAEHVTAARRVLRAAAGEWDRVDLRGMVDLGVAIMEHEA